MREATANNLRYVLLSNRAVPEYRVAPFGAATIKYCINRLFICCDNHKVESASK